MTRSWVVIGIFAIGCTVEPVGRDLIGMEADRGIASPSCASLGYDGTCVDDVSLWFQDGSCRVRDCAAEGKHCGHISDAHGYGCVEGTLGAKTFDCSGVGYEGTCLSGDVLVWYENAACRWADCAATGRSCGWNAAVGYDCVDESDDGDDDDPPLAGPLVVAGTQLNAKQEQWVRHIGESIVPQMKGTRQDRIAKAARVTWWSLKEGVLDLANPLSYSNCHFPPDQHIGPLAECPNPNNAWQVGISGVQAAWKSLAQVEQLAASVHPGKTMTQILVSAATAAGYGPNTATGQSIANATGRLRLSWLLRDGAVGFEAQYPTVQSECFVQGLYWCFGAGWPQSAAFAANKTKATQAVADLHAILDALAP